MPTDGSFTLGNGRSVQFRAIVERISDGPSDVGRLRTSIEIIGEANAENWCRAVNPADLVAYEADRAAAQTAFLQTLVEEQRRAKLAGELEPLNVLGTGALNDRAERISNVLSNQCLVASNEGLFEGNIIRASSEENQTGVVATAELRHYDASGNLEALFEGDGETLTVTEYDPANTQPWDTRTITTDATGRVTGDVLDYGDTVDGYVATHNLAAAQIGGMDANAAEHFVAAIEREVYSGDQTNNSSTSSVFGSDPAFSNATHDFRTGGFDIDVETGSVDTAPSETGTNVDLDPAVFGYGYDTSGYDDAYQDWNYQGYDDNYSTYDYDETWSYGDYWEPIVLDLDGNGIQLLGREESEAEFDLDGDGFDERTAWVGAGDGLLVLNDATNDLTAAQQAALQVASRVAITARHEVAFAAAGSGLTDLEALRANYDSNADGFLTAADTRWADFKIWKDTNGDGYSDPDSLQTSTFNENEVFTLAELGITSLSLTSDNREVTLPDNSIIHGFSTFTRNGVERALADVAFAYDPIGQKAPREALWEPSRQSGWRRVL